MELNGKHVASSSSGGGGGKSFMEADNGTHVLHSLVG
jgi:hypothetical protein